MGYQAGYSPGYNLESKIIIMDQQWIWISFCIYYNNNFGYQAGYGLTYGDNNNNFGRGWMDYLGGYYNNNFGYKAGYNLTRHI